MYQLAIVVALIKLYLVSDLEIVATFRPHDDLWYVQQAAAWIWERPYDNMALAHLPVYSGFIILTGNLGLPLRLASELFFIGSAWSASSALGRLGIPRSVQVLAFSVLIFHPLSFALHNYTLSETFAGPLYLLLVGQIIRVMDDPKSRVHIAGLAVTTALLWFCREESAALLLIMFALVALGLLLWRHRVPMVRQYAFALVAMPLVSVAALGALLSTANGLRYGVWAPTDLDMPKAAYAALQSIAVDHPKRFIPIPKESRLQAYAVSPAFAELQPIIDGPEENWGMSSGRAMGIEGEIGAGWMRWVLRDAAQRRGYYQSADTAREFYRRIVREINAAFADGRLKKRFTFGGFVDPALRTWLPFVASSLPLVARAVWPTAPFQAAAEESVSSDIYDRVTLRRIKHIDPKRDEIRKLVAENYVGAWIAAVILACVVAAFSGWGWSRLQIIIISLIGLLIASRIGLFTIVDASAWPGNQARYLYPAGLLLVLLPFVLAFTAKKNSHAIARF